MGRMSCLYGESVSKSTAIIFAGPGRRFIQTRPVTFFGEPIQWVDTTRYLGVTQDKRLTWSPHIDQVRNRATLGLGTLGPRLKRKSDLAVRNGVLLFKQLIRPMMEYACPAWRSAARNHVRRLQVLQSKCLQPLPVLLCHKTHMIRDRTRALEVRSRRLTLFI